MSQRSGFYFFNLLTVIYLKNEALAFLQILIYTAIQPENGIQSVHLLPHSKVLIIDI